MGNNEEWKELANALGGLSKVVKESINQMPDRIKDSERLEHLLGNGLVVLRMEEGYLLHEIEDGHCVKAWEAQTQPTPRDAIDDSIVKNRVANLAIWGVE